MTPAHRMMTAAGMSAVPQTQPPAVPLRESVADRAAVDWFVDPGTGEPSFVSDPLDLDPVSLSPRAPGGDRGEAVSPLSLLLGGSGDGDLAWQDQALCAQTDPEAFFPEKGGSTREAKKVCSSCDVRSECLEYALSNDERFGIWGGLSERERRRLKKQAG
ncbi:Sporulation regulatory protein WhiB [Brevibacterium yomogidense]|uniref:Transcriptional regulator WhiB n=1 Tax=Brevibacterium yomogidense TaxID=946573 RepID=A0A1X6XPU2_9MICO|nr:Sporulation regulatory protein WhiB [Brevibacterium yomogidense]